MVRMQYTCVPSVMSMSSNISKIGRNLSEAICCCKHVIILGDMLKTFHVNMCFQLVIVTNSEYQHTLPEAITQTCIVVFLLLVMEYIRLFT